MSFIFYLYSLLLSILPFALAYVLIKIFYNPIGVFQWIVFVILYVIAVPILFYLLNFLSGIIFKVLGLKRYAVKFGAVGGTARTIGNRFLHFKNLFKDDPDETNETIFQKIVLERINIPGGKNLEPLLYKTYTGLASLVVAILEIEAGFSKNSYENQSEFLEIIEEELTLLGIDLLDI
ncbi:MAG: hypothetical protein IPM42_17560 [Saprospiraceae bacterium]|nr:hypothetical protein [Saprospiraceae bacterium]